MTKLLVGLRVPLYLYAEAYKREAEWKKLEVAAAHTHYSLAPRAHAPRELNCSGWIISSQSKQRNAARTKHL
jgi:hypothetical protein